MSTSAPVIDDINAGKMAQTGDKGANTAEFSHKSPPKSPPKSPGSDHDPDALAAAAFEAETTIEAGDDDAGYESDTASSASTSVTSSVRDYAFENGRRYHKFREGQYHFPNDEREQSREDMKHAMVLNVCGGKLHYAPLENPHRILDLGTGTGIWCIDMGDEYPGASVLGIDLSPIQPTWIPPNVKFQVDDFESPWLFSPNTFSYVHARHIAPISKNLPKIMSQAYQSLEPGGWIEFQEQEFQAFCDDGTMGENWPVNEWWGFIREGLAVFQRDINAVLKVPGMLTEAGFINVEEKIIKLPMGIWPKGRILKVAGYYCRSAVEDGLEGLSLGPLTRGLGWTAAEVQVYLISVRKALLEKGVHAYCKLHVIYGQKPPANPT